MLEAGVRFLEITSEDKQMSKRLSIFLIIAAGLIGTFIGILQNVASSTIPKSWSPYLWIAWPLLCAFSIFGIIIAIWQYNLERRSHVMVEQLTKLLNPDESENQNGHFLYDAYISYSDSDKRWVRESLIPILLRENLRIALCDEIDIPGVPFIINNEQGIGQSKRTLIVLSPNYLSNNLLEFQNVLAQTLGIQEGSYRILPIKILPISNNNIPLRLAMLNTLDFTNPTNIEREYDRLIRALKEPLPRK